VLKVFAVGFLGAIAALMVAVAVWFAAFQPLGRPGLVWGGNVYTSKAEFTLYLRSKSLSYSTWLKRNPGVAPWEPGRRATSGVRGQSWDWKRDTLLAVNAALLATIAAALLAEGVPVLSRRDKSGVPARNGEDRTSPVLTATKIGAHAVGYIGIGASELTHAAINRVREHPGGQQEAVVSACFAALAVALGILVALLLV
jgi:hypothetical protein